MGAAAAVMGKTKPIDLKLKAASLNLGSSKQSPAASPTDRQACSVCGLCLPSALCGKETFQYTLGFAARTLHISFFLSLPSSH